MVLRSALPVSLLALWASFVLGSDDEWLSPVYKEIYQNPLPIPPIKEKITTYTNLETGIPIDYYEVDIKPFQMQVYKGLKPATLVGYDGMSPGPTFMMEKGRESVVRFINHGDRTSSVHLHGSYSKYYSERDC